MAVALATTAWPPSARTSIIFCAAGMATSMTLMTTSRGRSATAPATTAPINARTPRKPKPVDFAWAFFARGVIVFVGGGGGTGVEGALQRHPVLGRAAESLEQQVLPAGAHAGLSECLVRHVPIQLVDGLELGKRTEGFHDAVRGALIKSVAELPQFFLLVAHDDRRRRDLYQGKMNDCVIGWAGRASNDGRGKARRAGCRCSASRQLWGCVWASNWHRHKKCLSISTTRTTGLNQQHITGG